jgi:Secretion system C-terminal sorting domain
MKKRLFLQILVLFILLIAQQKVNAQTLSRDVISSGGEFVSNTDISLVFTIGEAFGGLQSNVPESRFLTVGFTQPDIELKEILDKDLSKNLTIFPNPTSDGLIKLALNRVPDANYTIDLIDAVGRVLQTTKQLIFNNNILYIPMNVSFLAKGTYFLRVRSDLNYRGQVKFIKL